MISSSDKPVEALGPPVPLEILAFGAAATLHSLQPVKLRGIAPSPDGGLIADSFAPFDAPDAEAARLDAIAGVVGHGLFGPDLVTDVIVARGEETEHRRVG